ncbi:hypothetical protein, partial [Salmonella enterica]|uniref:hypothetical protein n=1 Tax=Salmonella enterica TaxID=28901 RepID=UPI002159E64D
IADAILSEWDACMLRVVSRAGMRRFLGIRVALWLGTGGLAGRLRVVLLEGVLGKTKSTLRRSEEAADVYKMQV